MNVDNSREGAWKRMQERHSRGRDDDPELPLQGGGGGGTYDSMESRVAKLEAYMDASREDMRELKGDLKALIAKLGTFSTKADVTGFQWQWVLVSVGLFAIIVGSIIGGLGWLAAMMKP